MQFDFQTVSLSEINTDREAYRITTKTEVGLLADSIANVGLINSPILIRSGVDFNVVCGFRRIAALRSLDFKTSNARILSETLSSIDCVTLAITDNALQRVLNPIEISRALLLLSHCFPAGPDFYQTAGVLGLPNHPGLVEKMIMLCQLPIEVQKGVIEGDISPQVAYLLAAVDAPIAQWFASVFTSLKISLNKQKEIITLSQEIAHREDIPLQVLLWEKPLRDILTNPELDRTQQAAGLRSYLRLRRFPSLTRARDEFDLVLKTLKLGSLARLIPPVDFEGMQYHIQLAFKNLNELERHKTTIDQVVHNDHFKRFLDKTA